MMDHAIWVLRRQRVVGYTAILLAGRALSAQATAPTAVSLPADTMVRAGRLANGFRYIIRHNGTPKGRALFMFYVDAGSVLEDNDQRGVAHFVEHLEFNGSRHFPHQRIIDYMTSLGMRFGNDLGATTQYDRTSYMIQAPTDPAVLDTCLLIVDDWAHGATIDSAAVEKERGIIMEERRQMLGPQLTAYDLHAPVLLGQRYASRNPIGSGEVISHVPRSAIMRFYRDWYRPDLEAVIVVGDFDAKTMEAKVRTLFGRIPARTTERPRPPIQAVRHSAPIASVVADAHVHNWQADLIFEREPAKTVLTATDLHNHALNLLFYAILNARLRTLARTPHAPVRKANIDGRDIGRTGLADDIYLIASEPTTLELGVTAVMAEVARLGRDGVTGSELEQIKKTAMEALTAWERDSLQTVDLLKVYASYLAQSYASNNVFGEGIADPREANSRLRTFVPGITTKEIQGVANRILTVRNPVVLATVPKEAMYAPPEQDELLASLSAGASRILPPYQEAASEGGGLVTTPPTPGRIVRQRTISALGVTEWTLSNGVRVLLKPTSGDRDALTIAALSVGGTSLASDSQYLNATVASRLVTLSGVGAFDVPALRRRLSGEVQQWTVDIGADSTEVSVEGSPRYAATLFQLLYLTFTAPRLDSAEVDKWRSETRRKVPDPVELAVTRALAQRHPRARPVIGPVADSVNADSALAFYRARFANAGPFTVVVVGHFDADSLRPFIEQYIGGLPGHAGALTMARDLGIRPPVGVVQQAVVGTDSASTTTLVFDTAIPYSLQEETAVQALSAIISERLRIRMREQMSGIYSPEVLFETTNLPYAHVTAYLRFTSAPERANLLERALLAVLDSVTIQGVSPQEVHDIQNFLRQRRKLDEQRNRYWMKFLTTDVVLRGQPLDTLAAWEQQVAAVTPGLLNDIARRLFGQHRYVVVRKIPVRMAPMQRDELISAEHW